MVVPLQKQPRIRNGINKTMSFVTIAKLKPMTSKYRMISSKRSQERQGLIQAAKTPATKQVVGTFKSSRLKWEATTRDLENFMYPSLVLDDEGKANRNINDLTWRMEGLFKNPEPENPSLGMGRIDKNQREMAILDRKFDFAERLLRLQIFESDLEFLSSQDQELVSVEKYNFSDKKATESAITFGLSKPAQTRSHYNKMEKHISENGQQLYYTQKENLFKKWGHIIASQNSGNTENNTVEREMMLKNSMSPRSDFFQECIQINTVPEPILSRISSLGDFTLNHFGLGNEKAKALTKSIKNLETLRKVNLSDNRMNSETVQLLLKALSGRSDLLDLDLSANEIGSNGCHQLGDFIASVKNLRAINISKTKINDPGLILITKHIEVHPRLQQVNISNNEISESGGNLIGSMIECSSCCISNLDISWNRICKKGAIAIGKGLRLNTSLRILNICMNRFGDRGGQEVASALMKNPFLEELDLSRNGLGGESAITFGYSLLQNKTLRILNLDDNPIGSQGARAILSSIANGAKCKISILVSGFENQDHVFDIRIPSLYSPYVLDVENCPYHYVIACQLLLSSGKYRTCDLYDISHVTNDTKRSVYLEYSEEWKTLVECADSRQWKVPEEGVLNISCRFTPKPVSERGILSMDRLTNLLEIIRRGLTPKQVGCLLELAVTDIYITTNQAEIIIKSIGDILCKTEIISSIYLSIYDGENIYCFLKRNVTSEDHKLLVLLRGYQTMSFNPDNPSDHYKLELSDKHHRMITLWLASINGREAEFSQFSSGRNDTSQNGDWNNFRNARLNGQQVKVDNEFLSKLPSKGVLELDYISTSRPFTTNITPLSDASLTSMLESLGSDLCTNLIIKDKVSYLKHQLLLLRSAIVGKFITIQQAIGIITYYPKNIDGFRATALVYLFGSILDIENVMDAVDKLNPNDRKIVFRRIGYLNLINPFKLQREYDICLEYLDERVFIKCIMDLIIADPRDVIRVYQDRSSVKMFDLFAVHTMPTKGLFVFKYNSHSKDKPAYTRARMGVLKLFLMATQPVRNPSSSLQAD